MTQQDGALLTRRALRMQAAAAVPEPTTLTLRTTDPSATAVRPAVTRRDLRLATATALRTDASGPAITLTPAEDVATTQTVAARRAAEDAATDTATSLGTAGTPLTRRELRLRERARALEAEQPTGPDAAEVAAACRPPFTASLVLPVEGPEDDAAPRTPHVPATSAVPAPDHRTGAASAHPAPAAQRPAARPARSTDTRRLLAHVGRRPVAVVALSAGLLTAGVTQVHAEQGVVAQAQAAMERAAVAAEVERQQRVEGAARDRLTAQAATYAAAQRTQALTAAEQAVAAAHGAKEVAAPVVEAEKVVALEAAAAELAAMVEAAPVPALEGLAARSPEATDAAAEGTDPAAEAAAQGRTDQTSRSVAAEGRAPLPETAEGTAPDAAPAPEAAPSAEVAADEAATPAAEAATDAAPADLAEALPDLDIEVTRRIREQAEQVAALTAEVQGLADARIAEAAAAAAAAEAERLAAEAAAQAAAAELARKVAIAEDSPNGDIPTDVLCGVDFSAGVLLRCDAAAALEELNAAYRAEFGRDLDVVSSYRSYSAQVAVKRTRGGLAAQPGTSNHGRAVAVDFGGFGGLGNFSTANYRWMRANAEDFGWFHPRIMQPGGGGPQEPWHWEFGTDE